jgi:subtilisin-like proprotein convertase family protein
MRTFKLLALAASTALATPAMAADFVFAGPVAIPASGTAGPASVFPIQFNVSGLGTVLDVNLTLTGLTHSFADDLQILLASPTGTMVGLMVNAGGTANFRNTNLTFDDQAPTALPNNNNSTNAVYASGSYLPSTYALGPVISALIDGTSLSLFNGETANGIWSLYIRDDEFLDVGALAGATLSISATPTAPAVPEPATWAMMIGGLGVVGMQLRRRKTTVSFV